MKTTEATRLKEVIDYLEVNSNKLSAILGLSQPSISAQINGVQAINRKIIDGLMKNYPEINIKWLLTGEGEMIISKSAIIVASANAGYIGVGVSQIYETNKRIMIKNINPNAKCLYIDGDSMYPALINGCTVICERLMDLMDIRSTRIYVIVTTTGVSAKKVKINMMNQTAILIPENPEYQSHTIPINEILECWEVKVILYDSKLE